MKVNFIRFDSVYKKIMNAPFWKKDDINRYEMMVSARPRRKKVHSVSEFAEELSFVSDSQE